MAGLVEIYRGDTPLFDFTIKQADGTPLVLTDADVYFAARPQGGGDYLFNVSCTILDAAAGTVQIRLTESNTARAGTYTAEVEVRFVALSQVFTVNQFTLTIKDDVRK